MRELIATIAVCFLIGSKQDTDIDLGSSSTIRSTPVKFSKALIFLPSLPIILPFISSLGSSMDDTDDSPTTSEANLCMDAANISLAFSSA